MGTATGVTDGTGETHPVAAGRQAPHLPHGLVSRSRVLEPLLASPPARIVLLTAPAGYSKTTCLAHWAAADPRQFAWVSGTRLHNDAALLVSAIIDALEEIQPVDPGVAVSLANATPSLGSVVLPRLAGSLAERAEPFVLVIDNAEELTSPDAAMVMESIADALPRGSQLGIGSRVEPPLPLGRLRAHRDLVELGLRDLAMSRSESSALLAGLDVDLTEGQLDVLFERTEGWPAALYLAGLALRETADRGAFITTFAGDDQIVVEYLRDEFLAAVDDERLAFLTQSSVLEELTAPLCDAVLQSSGSARVLDEPARGNSMVQALDRKGERYRYHQLFAEALRSVLRRRDPGLERDLHARASRWYADHGEVDASIEHAIAAGDSALAGELIWAGYPGFSSQGRIPTVERWLAELGDIEIAASCELALAAGHCAVTMAMGDRAAHWLRMAERAAEGRAEFAGDLSLLRALLGLNGVAAVGRDAERASEKFADGDIWQTPCYYFRGVSSHLTGHPERARPLLQEAVRRGVVNASVIEVIALAQLVLIALDEGDASASLRLASQAREQVQRCGLGDYPTVALVHSVCAAAFAAESRTDQARAEAKAARHLLADAVRLPGWYEAQCCVALARALVKLDDLEEVEALLGRADRLLAEIGDAALGEQWLREAKSSLEAALAQGRGVDWPLTPAEVRTLQYLPSHLSFREIGERIHVSPNTVKTQAQAIYRKLDVSSRAAAVERARSAGLLEKDGGPGFIRNG